MIVNQRAKKHGKQVQLVTLPLYHMCPYQAAMLPCHRIVIEVSIQTVCTSAIGQYERSPSSCIGACQFLKARLEYTAGAMQDTLLCETEFKVRCLYSCVPALAGQANWRSWRTSDAEHRLGQLVYLTRSGRLDPEAEETQLRSSDRTCLLKPATDPPSTALELTKKSFMCRDISIWMG